MPRIQDLISGETEQRTFRDETIFAKIDHEVRVCVEAIEHERK